MILNLLLVLGGLIVDGAFYIYYPSKNRNKGYEGK